MLLQFRSNISGIIRFRTLRPRRAFPLAASGDYDDIISHCQDEAGIFASVLPRLYVFITPAYYCGRGYGDFP